jgi:hypothetical protein
MTDACTRMLLRFLLFRKYGDAMDNKMPSIKTATIAPYHSCRAIVFMIAPLNEVTG